ncbi:hypothetical protein K4F52_006311 [Lecanicillium sp. MT-2017a]|nr:hypothetical protein K4F52_006311 [Lecanicillium sp. MT-2017a]
MESSPLTKAHDHAHAASVATRQSADTTVAVNEHTQAAGEFASAAKNTTSVEALRTLKLLEAHHKRLAELLRLPPELPSQGSDGDWGEKARGEKDAAAEENSQSAKGTPESAPAKTAHMPGLSQQRRNVSREMSSSIASNLASARGIRSKYRGQPLSPSMSNDQAPGNVDPHPRRDGSRAKMQNLMDTQQQGKPTWVPPSPAATKSEGRARAVSAPTVDSPSAAVDDGGYSKFYNTFGSLINKISAPLAFAGLPLIQEESITSDQQVPEPTSPKRRSRTVPSPNLDPDLSKIYSTATMKALAREGHAPHESFYVVPSTGHTMSYANILSYAEKEKRRLGTSIHSSTGAPAEEEEDDFVDAHEVPAALSPGARRRVGKVRSERELNNTIEELSTENKSLKDMLDKLAKRLHTFEASAQSSAMALAESYRLMRPSSPTATKHDDAGAQRSVHETEEQLAAVMKQMERLEKDNRKMQKTLEKYREKWEMLKAGAKARREGQKVGDGVDDES